MADNRKKNVNWVVADIAGNSSIQQATLAVLMDIRDELLVLNRKLSCSDVLAIPRLLREIARNTRRKRKMK